MSDKQVLEDPINRVVCVFDDLEQATTVREELVDSGVVSGEIRVLDGQSTAEDVDTSAKWFADTDVQIERYQKELRNGNTVLSIPVSDSENRDKIQTTLKQRGARLITHFGQWITETMQ